MNLPKVSICMPVYNGGRYFAAALDSALSQQYDNLEIVVVNDGSTDDGETERVALAAGDRVTYVHQQNRGVAGALNTAIATMTGDYFAWLSHDDLHLPTKTAAQIAFLHKLGRPDACLFSDFDLIGPKDEPITTVRLPAEAIRQNPRLPLYNGIINGCTLLIPVNVMRAYMPFDEARRCTQDYDLWNRMLAQHEFFHQPEVLIRYRIHPEQGSHSALAVSEGNVLWAEMLASRNEVERAQMFGSTRRYYASLSKFLQTAPYPKVAADTRAQVATAGAGALVSVVLAFRDQIPETIRAARSVLAQTYAQIELLLVDDGSLADLQPVRALAQSDERVRLLSGPPTGQATARNRALAAAQGAYIAFLQPGDRFVSHKLERQIDLMQREGALFSHTSLYLDRADGQPGLGTGHTGRFGGDCYPRIIAACPIVLSTVILHRSVVDAGLAFRTDNETVSDVLAWIELAVRYSLLGVDEPLSHVTIANAADARPPAERLRRLCDIAQALASEPQHQPYHHELEALRRARAVIARRWIAAGRHLGAMEAGSPLLTEADAAPFPIGPAGRIVTVGVPAP